MTAGVEVEMVALGPICMEAEVAPLRGVIGMQAEVVTMREPLSMETAMRNKNRGRENTIDFLSCSSSMLWKSTLSSYHSIH